MPYDDPDPQDPNVLVGVELPGTREEMLDMAWVFAEEFARLGHDADGLLALFRDPRYAGAHRALRVLGDEEIRGICAETSAAFGAGHLTIVDAPDPTPAGPGPRRLTVLGS